MLIQRVLTAAVLLPLLLLAVWKLEGLPLYLVFSVVALAGSWEWAALMRKPMMPFRIRMVVMTALLLAAGWELPGLWPRLMLAAVLVWLVIAVMILISSRRESLPPVPGASVTGILGPLLLMFTAISTVVLRSGEHGVWPLLYSLFLVFVADTGAYFAGRQFGRHKLAPAISPGKTIEGAAGALMLCALWAWFAGSWAFGLTGAARFGLLAWSMLVALLSISGDLLESLMKRSAGLKDSGRLLPGHGGVLDRIDSVMAALPGMAAGAVWLGWLG